MEESLDEREYSSQIGTNTLSASQFVSVVACTTSDAGR